MMIPPTAGSPYAAAAALDRQLRTASLDASDSDAPDSGPDVVVTLSRGASSSPGTYDATGKVSAAPTLDDMGADASDSLAQASESVDGEDATSTGDASSAPADADQDAAVPA